MTLAFQIGFLEIGFKDILDILLVSFLLAQVYKLMKGSVAIKVFGGFLSIYLIYLVVNALQMELLSTILGQFMGVGVLAVIILFQQEIRKFLLLVGRTNFLEDGTFFKNVRFWSQKNGKNQRANIIPIVEAVKSLAGSNTGALIVLSQASPLKFYAESGDLMDSLLSKRLLMAIFNKYSPLHDGAVIVHKDRIVAARCILPVTETDISAQYGLRHRAGLGMSENTETFVIVVSEETGQISAMQSGETMHNISTQELRRQINKYFNEPKESKKEKEKKESTESEIKEALA